MLRAGLRMLLDAQPDMVVVAEAADGPEAARKAKQLHPDVAVLDLTMPNTDPAFTIRQLTRLGARTVVLTMHDDPAYADAAFAAGALGFVVKKAADVELLSAIRAVSRGRRFLDAGAGHVGRSRGAARLRQLSQREDQALRLLGYGFTNREIAARLGVSVKTAETFRARICQKLGLRSRAELVQYALRMGLVSAEGDDAKPGKPPPRSQP